MEKAKLIKKTIDDILKHIDISCTTIVDKNEDIYEITIEGDNLNYLIGYRGESLDALQNFVSLITYKKLGEWVTIVTDINDYRKQKHEKIEEITKNYIDRVRFLEKEIEMPIMSSHERRYVHVFISQYDDILSESIGNGSQRRVVLKPKSK